MAAFVTVAITPKLFGRGAYNGPAKDEESDDEYKFTMAAPVNSGRGSYNKKGDDDEEEDGRGAYN
ncbi:hypothetical protein BP5796_00040 [Coleophoma crateriformis]|uniref:Uncharacterized protein n=1 Tax=Coleophoma crateriformis TaxID=565419 RepID=A0A3D8T6U6_9HELO|nr:hypothetical protein BP5796_00040 [Coleophoma crateriformis]